MIGVVVADSTWSSNDGGESHDELGMLMEMVCSILRDCRCCGRWPRKSRGTATPCFFFLVRASSVVGPRCDHEGTMKRRREGHYMLFACIWNYLFVSYSDQSLAGLALWFSCGKWLGRSTRRLRNRKRKANV